MDSPGTSETPEPDRAAREAAAALRDVRSQLDEVQAALVRLDAGTYGRCEACGDEIPDSILEQHPTARHCAEHG